MSYKTNPITNRFNINKGWKNSSFPEKLSFYARDNTFFFKIFLFLKAYFAIRKINLIACEIRVSEEHTPILYLVINTNSRRKKKRTSFIRHSSNTYAGLKFSPLSNPLNNDSLNLMFLNVFKLKKILNSAVLPLIKRKPSRLWLTKPRFRNWLNYLGYIKNTRRNLIKIQTFKPKVINTLSNKVQNSLKFALSKSIKEIEMLKKIFNVLIDIKCLTTLSFSWYKKRLKTLYFKIKRINSFLSKIKERQNFKNTRKFDLYKKQRLRNLILKLKQKQFRLFQNNLKRTNFPNTVLNKLRLYEISPHLNKLLILNKFNTSNRLHKCLNNKQNKTLRYLFNKRHLGFKTKKRPRAFSWRLQKNLRIKKKIKPIHATLKKIHAEIVMENNFYKQVRIKNKKNIETKVDMKLEQNIKTYRQPFRKIYRNNLNILVRYQYKVWIQNVLNFFFKTRFEVKFVQPITEFKNLKLLRFVYPLQKFRQQSKIKFYKAKQNLSKKEHKAREKRYVYLGTNIKKFLWLQKNLRNNKYIHINTYPFYKKADLFKRLRRQKLQNFSQNRLSSIKNKLLMRQFLPVLTLFIKYLNPQILADHIATEFEKTKKHRKIFFALKTALRALKFYRGIGYRIAIVGRLNSAAKSHTYYLTKNCLSRLNFSNKVNYATAQAKGRIGAFGIKVWVFY